MHAFSGQCDQSLLSERPSPFEAGHEAECCSSVATRLYAVEFRIDQTASYALARFWDREFLRHSTSYRASSFGLALQFAHPFLFGLQGPLNSLSRQLTLTALCSCAPSRKFSWSGPLLDLKVCGVMMLLQAFHVSSRRCTKRAFPTQESRIGRIDLSPQCNRLGQFSGKYRPRTMMTAVAPRRSEVRRQKYRTVFRWS